MMRLLHLRTFECSNSTPRCRQTCMMRPLHLRTFECSNTKQCSRHTCMVHCTTGSQSAATPRHAADTRGLNFWSAATKQPHMPPSCGTFQRHIWYHIFWYNPHTFTCIWYHISWYNCAASLLGNSKDTYGTTFFLVKLYSQTYRLHCSHMSGYSIFQRHILYLISWYHTHTRW